MLCHMPCYPLEKILAALCTDLRISKGRNNIWKLQKYDVVSTHPLYCQRYIDLERSLEGLKGKTYLHHFYEKNRCDIDDP